MKIEIEKKHGQVIDFFTKDQLILQVRKEGVYKYFMCRGSVGIDGLVVDEGCQIQEERDT